MSNSCLFEDIDPISKSLRLDKTELKDISARDFQKHYVSNMLSAFPKLCEVVLQIKSPNQLVSGVMDISTRSEKHEH